MQGTKRMRLDRLWILLPPALGFTLALAACSRSGPDELAWAHAALQRNGTLEVVATDPASGVLTVRIKSTGELRTVHAGDLIGALPIGSPEAEAAGGTPAAPSSPAGAPAAQASSPAQAAQAAPSTSTVAGGNAAASPENGTGSPQHGSSGSADGGPTSAEQAPAPAAAAPAVPEKEKTAPKGDKRVLAAGPGYSISAAGPAAAARTVSQSATDSAAGGVRNGPVEQRHEPIVCQGGGLRHIDNLNLEFDGDALIAEDGCELHITNSRIAAQGIGVLVRAANVHIENSSIEGGPSAIDASDGAQIYAQSSTFKGMIRRLDTASFHDLGGNVGD
jgi:hypothetical protein